MNADAERNSAICAACIGRSASVLSGMSRSFLRVQTSSWIVVRNSDVSKIAGSGSTWRWRCFESGTIACIRAGSTCMDRTIARSVTSVSLAISSNVANAESGLVIAARITGCRERRGRRAVVQGSNLAGVNLVFQDAAIYLILFVARSCSCNSLIGFYLVSCFECQ